MKAKELIDMIRANFNDDEEVTFLYYDDQGAVRSTDAKVNNHTQTTVNGHWEMKQIDPATHKEEWIKTDTETAYYNEHGCRYEVDGYISDTKKVIEVL